MNNPSWRSIIAFLHVVEGGSFTLAANASGLSKANLSQRVTDLENELGVQLLHRTTRQLQLTEIGQGYYQRCKQLSEQINLTNEWATQTKNELKGKIRMNSVGGPIGEDVIAPLIIDFISQHPDISVELDFSSKKVDLVSDKYDLVLRMGDLPDSSLVAKNLSIIKTRYVASPSFLQQYGEITNPEQLKQLPLIYGSVDQWTLSSATEQCIVYVNKGLKVTSGKVMRQAALAGLGVTRLADIYVQSDIDQGRLVDVLPEWNETTQLSLIFPPIRYQLQRVRVLIDWLSAELPSFYKKQTY